MNKEEKVLELDLEAVTISKSNPRTCFDQKKMDDLKASIVLKGVIQPIVVREKSEGGYKYEIIFGERRYRASIAAKKKTIPAIVKEISDTQVIEYQLIENLQRDEMSAMEEAKAFKRMTEEFKNTIKMIAEKVSKPVKYIHTRLRLLSLPEEIQKAIYKCLITAEHGIILSRLPNPVDQNKLLVKIISDKLSVNAAENMLRHSGKSLVDASFDTASCSKCPKLGKNQTLDLFDKDTDIDNICLDGICWARRERESGKRKPKTDKPEAKKMTYREVLEIAVIKKIHNMPLSKLEIIAKQLEIDPDAVKESMKPEKADAKPKSAKKEQKCRICGCTEEKPCKGGCARVEPDLCSKCKKKGMKIVAKVTAPGEMTADQKKATAELAGTFGGKKK